MSRRIIQTCNLGNRRFGKGIQVSSIVAWRYQSLIQWVAERVGKNVTKLKMNCNIRKCEKVIFGMVLQILLKLCTQDTE